MFGMANLFVTLNFNTEKSVLRFQFDDATVLRFKLGDMKKGRNLVARGTTPSMRRVESAANPIQDVQLFTFLTKNVLKYLFGIPDDLNTCKKSGYEKSQRGLLGTCQWYSGPTETNQRKFLHVHLLLKVYELKAAKKMLRRRKFKKELTGFIDSIVDASLLPDADHMPTSVAKYEEMRAIEKAAMVKAELDWPDTPNREFIPPFADFLEMMVPGVLPDNAAELADEFWCISIVRDVLAVMKREALYHNCTYTCFKTAFQKLHKICRLRQKDMPLSPFTKIDPKTGKVILRRNIARIVATNMGLAYATGCNSNVQILTLAEAVSAHYYCLAYTFKLDAHCGVDIAWMQRNLLKKLEYLDGDDEQAEARTSQALANSYVAGMTFSAMGLVQYVCDFPDVYSSHNVVSLDWFGMVQRLEELGCIDIMSWADQGEESMLSLRRSGKAVDYTEDYTAIDARICPYYILMFYKKVARRTRKGRPVELDDGDIGFNACHSNKNKHKLKSSGQVSVPKFAFRTIPKANEALFNLFICVAFTTIVRDCLLHPVKHTVLSIATMSKEIQHNDPFVRHVVNNIEAWQKGKEAAAAESRRQREIRAHQAANMEPGDVGLYRLARAEQRYYGGQTRLLAQVCLDEQRRVVDLAELGEQLHHFDIQQVLNQPDQPTSNPDAFKKYLTQRLTTMCSFATAFHGESKVYLEKLQSGTLFTRALVGEGRTRKRKQEGKVRMEGEKRVRRELYKAYKAANDKTLKRVPPATDKNMTLDDKWFTTGSSARCLDSHEWDELQRKWYYKRISEGTPELSSRDIVSKIAQMLKDKKWTRLGVDVTAANIIKAFTLSAEQAFPFLVFVDHMQKLSKYLEDPSQSTHPDPLLLYIDGLPGSGKSHLAKAMQMYLFQHGLLDSVRACSPTAKAALNMTTPELRADTNHSLFGLSVVKGKDGTTSTVRRQGSILELRGRLFGVLYILMDEGSLLPASLMGMINAQLQGLSSGHGEVLGGRSFIIFGDQCQLALGRALAYRFNVRNGKEKTYSVEELRQTSRQKNYGMIGRQIWLRFRAYQLTSVNRFLRTTDGMRCAKITMAWRNGVVLPAHVDWLQSRWIGNSEVDIHSGKWKKAYFVHPRNAVLDKVTPMLQLLEGLTSGETVYI